MRISDWSSDVCSSDLALCPAHQFKIGLIGGSARLRMGGKGRVPHDLLVPHIDIERHARAGDAGHVLNPGRTDRSVSSIISRVEVPRISVPVMTKYPPPCWPGLNLSQVDAHSKPKGSALLQTFWISDASASTSALCQRMNSTRPVSSRLSSIVMSASNEGISG